MFIDQNLVYATGLLATIYATDTLSVSRCTPGLSDEDATALAHNLFSRRRGRSKASRFGTAPEWFQAFQVPLRTVSRGPASTRRRHRRVTFHPGLAANQLAIWCLSTTTPFGPSIRSTSWRWRCQSRAREKAISLLGKSLDLASRPSSEGLRRDYPLLDHCLTLATAG